MSDLYRQPPPISPAEQARIELEESKNEPILRGEDGKAAVAEARRQLQRSRKAKLEAP